MRASRSRLACLWVSQTARIAADHCLKSFIVLLVGVEAVREQEVAWHWLSLLFALPALLLAPVNGALGNALPKRFTLVGSSILCLAGVAWGWVTGNWSLGVATIAVGAAVYSPTRYALLPAAARDARLPLSRINGFIESGSVGAIVAGLLLGGWLFGYPGISLRGLAPFPSEMPAPIVVALALNCLALLAALPAHFPSDVRRQEAPALAVVGFFRDAHRIGRAPEARALLLGLAGFRGLVAAGTGAIVAATLTAAPKAAGPIASLLGNALWILLGAVAGSLLAGVQGHMRRALGLVPLGLLGFVISLGVALLRNPDVASCLALGVAGGLINVPLMAAYQAALPADARGNGMAVLNAVGYAFMVAAVGLMWLLAHAQLVHAKGQLVVVLLVSALAMVLAWRALLRQCLEQILEIVLWPMYRIQGFGPGLADMPRKGPVLIVCNHSSWCDPLWLGKVVPRGLTPMMTSEFYDLPVLRWLMTHVVHAIRVPVAEFRRTAPEIQEAVRALDRGQCLLLFPEGRLRRRADQPIRPFGQGVWHILRERPQTPVVPCWIEGGWGSYFSYLGGPPTKNKHWDIRRRIDVALAATQRLDTALLQDHRATREHLRKACLVARECLGLQPIVDEPSKPEPALTADSTEA